MHKALQVFMNRHLVEVLEDGQVTKTITSCAFGRPGHTTPEISHGDISLTKRDRVHKSTIYNGASMPFALFFEQDPTCAFHQGNVDVASHGCVHLSETDAKWLFDWAGSDPVALDIHGPYPASPTSSGKWPPKADVIGS